MSHGFTLGLRSAKIGVTHPGVARLQAYLARFGYLKTDVIHGTLDRATSDALRVYQSTAQLPPTGQLDEATVAMVERPRCGLPDTELVEIYDQPQPTDPIAAPYVLVGCSFTKTGFLHRFINGTPDLAADTEREPVRRALATWAGALCGMTFSETADSSSDLATAWYTGNHGDGFSFDGPGNVLAHAFFPPPCGGSFAGQMHFDDAENWSLDGVSGFDLETVALHEIGHLLGLGHSSDPNAVMFASYGGVRRVLHQDDVDGIRRLYPYLCRVGDSQNQAGGVSEIACATGDGARLVTAVRALDGSLRLIAWSLVSGSLLARLGSAGAGEATSIRIASDSASRYVTALRTGAGTLKLIAWSLSSGGAIARTGDSGALGSAIVSVDLVSITSDVFVTACRRADGRLTIARWNITASGAIVLAAEMVTSDDVTEVATIAALGSDRVVSAVRLASGDLKVSAWQIGASTITPLGSAGAGAVNNVTVSRDSFGRAVTGVRDGSGQLKLIVWNVSAGGAVSRLGDSAGLFNEGSLDHSLSFHSDVLATAVRTSAGLLKIILWSTTSAGAVKRTGDSAFLGDAVTLARVSASPNRYASAVRLNDGSLRVILWRTP